MRTLLPLLSCLAFFLLTAPQADAARHRHHARRPPPPPPVRVVVKPSPRRAHARSCPGHDSVWVGGHPGAGGQWIPGHCQAVGPAPRSGWLYVSGYWNGRIWVTGFWRPSARVGYAWVDAHVTDSDDYVAGYWEPEGDGPEGMMWRHGYFDGSDWVAGGWVPTESYQVYDDDGELAFFAVGDGHVEELAIPAAGIDEVGIGSSDPGAVAAESLGVEPDPEAPVERHAEVPE
jgi:hypothetical protein